MNEVEMIKEAAKGLRYVSETDHPFEVQEHTSHNPAADQVLALCGSAPGIAMEKQTLDYFFRNMVKVYPESTTEEVQLAKKFSHLQELLQQKLKGIEVYRLGEIAIDAVIAGWLPNGNLVTLRTKVVET